MNIPKTELLKSLEEIREKHGEEAYSLARRSFARALILDPKGEEFLRETFPDLDFETLRTEAQASKRMHGDEQSFMAMIRLYVPNLTTQFQYDLFMTAFMALTQSLNGYFGGHFQQAEEAKESLNQLFETARNSYKLAEKVQEIPEQGRSEKASSFVNTPKEFTEIDEQRRLLAELDAITNALTLNSWYMANRTRIETVVTKKYRDELFDAIRGKQSTTSN